MKNILPYKAMAFSSLLVLSASAAHAGGGSEPAADPGPNPNPDIFDVPGNLIKNGNFELLDDRMGERNGYQLSNVGWRGWELYQKLPHWFTSFGGGIELQRSGAVYPQGEFGGGQYVELDSTSSGVEASNSWMTQAVSGLTIGQAYTLEMLYHRNPNTASEQDRGIAVYWGKHIPGKLACVLNAENSEEGWKDVSCSITATAEDMHLTFAAFGNESNGTWGNNVGGLIDFVRLTPTESP